MKSHRTTSRSQGLRPGSGAHEWVGGRMVSPFYITEGNPYRPDLILWQELPSEIILFVEAMDPKHPSASFGDTLLQAMKDPHVGPPRRPRMVRVADEDLAAEVRRVLPETRVVVAPTPELDLILEHMKADMTEDEDQEEASYFENGRVRPETVEALFRSAQILYNIAPWKVVADGQVLRVDIPEYGIEGACLSIIGALGQSTGLVLFPSWEAFQSFMDAADRFDRSGERIDFGTSTLSLNYEAASDLPGTMLREARQHGWPVADSKAYPMVLHADQDAVHRPLTDREVRAMAALATSLVTFFVKHRDLFEEDVPDEPVCESYFDENDLEVRFTFPYEAGELFEVNSPRRSASEAGPLRVLPGGKGAARVGRNDPCPCGSGKKYKRCCLVKEQEERDREAASVDREQGLLNRMARFARERFGPAWSDLAEQAFHAEDPPEDLFLPWTYFHHDVAGGKSILHWFLEEESDRLSDAELSWLNAQRAAWLSVWEVLEVEPGRQISMKDLLTGETRVVTERTASKTLRKRDAVLVRIVDHQGTSQIWGLYPRSLPPAEAALVCERMHTHLRRKGLVPIERLRPERVSRYLIARWEEMLEAWRNRARSRPVLQNTDGDPLLLTTDHFAFDPADRGEIQRRLAAAEEVEDPPEPESPEQVYVFSRAAKEGHGGLDRLMVGTVRISGEKLAVETNSIRRADSMRARLESLLGPLVRHRAREHADAMASLSRDRMGPSIPPEIPAEELDRIVLEMKTKHYADWADHPLPALSGQTPREAARTEPGRRKVDLLIKESENMESRLPPGQRFDFGGIRRDLGLEG